MSSDRWSFSAGPHGCTARVFERKRGGNVYLESWSPEKGRKVKTSQELRVRDAEGELMEEAVKEAEALAVEASNALIRGRNPHRSPVSLKKLLKLFKREEVADMEGRHKEEVKRELELFERFLGAGFRVSQLGPREWNAIRRARASGEIDARGRQRGHPEYNGREVGPRTVAKTLKVLRQVCRFGARWRTRGGEFLLEADPTRGLELPREQDPNRPVCSDELLKTLLEAAPNVKMGHEKEEDRQRSYLRELLVLAAETGARIGSIVALRWSDWDPDAATFGTLRWRAEHDKGDRTRVTPVTVGVREALEAHRQRHPGVGEAWIFPAPESSGHLRVDVALRWWREAETEAEVPHEKGMGFHALRRRFANKLRDHSPVDVAALTGHQDVATLQEVYQRSDTEAQDRILREAFGGRSG